MFKLFLWPGWIISGLLGEWVDSRPFFLRASEAMLRGLHKNGMLDAVTQILVLLLVVVYPLLVLIKRKGLPLSAIILTWAALVVVLLQVAKVGGGGDWGFFVVLGCYTGLIFWLIPLRFLFSYLVRRSHASACVRASETRNQSGSHHLNKGSDDAPLQAADG